MNFLVLTIFTFFLNSPAYSLELNKEVSAELMSYCVQKVDAQRKNIDRKKHLDEGYDLNLIPDTDSADCGSGVFSYKLKYIDPELDGFDLALEEDPKGEEDCSLYYGSGKMCSKQLYKVQYAKAEVLVDGVWRDAYYQIWREKVAYQPKKKSNESLAQLLAKIKSQMVALDSSQPTGEYDPNNPSAYQEDTAYGLKQPDSIIIDYTPSTDNTDGAN